MECRRVEELSVDSSFCDALRRQIGASRYSTWFEGTDRGVGISVRRSDDSHEAIVTTRSSFEQSLLRRQLQNDLQEAAAASLGPQSCVRFEIGDPSVKQPTLPASESQTSEVASPLVEPTQPAPKKPTLTPPPKPTETAAAPTPAVNRSDRQPQHPAVASPPMSGWVVGEGNAPATHICQRLIRGEAAPSPVLLWGPSGAGKTHLLRAITQGARARRRRVLATSGEEFLRGFVEAARAGGFPSFRQKHQGADYLLIDDIQQLLGKTRTIEEFRQTVDSYLEAGGQVVLTADRGPKELLGLGPEIASRLAGGLPVETPMPDATVREGIARQIADEIGFALPESVARTLACRLLGGGREIRGALNRMALLQATFDSPIDDQLALQVADDTNRLSTPPVRLSDIQKAVCGVCGVDAKALRSDKRTKAVTEPRMLAMWLARKMTGSAWSEIGDYFGRRSHSTVIAAHRRVERLLQSGEPKRLVAGELGETIRRIEAELRTA